MHNRCHCGKIYDSRKNAVVRKFCRNELCQPNCIPNIFQGCGKLLLTTLWRMWKSPSFQQVFESPCFSFPHVENFAYGLHKAAKIRFPDELRKGCPPGFFPAKRSKLLDSSVILTVKKSP